MKIFAETIEKIKGGYVFEVGEREEEDYFIVVEENRMDSYFVHIVPKEIYKLFTGIRFTFKIIEKKEKITVCSSYSSLKFYE